MHLRGSSTALVTVLLVGAASGVGFGSACATGAPPNAVTGDDASVADTGAPQHDSSSGGSSSGGGCDANTATDWTNCGSCGHQCATGQICNVGQCQDPCTAPQVVCPGVPGCFDLTSDNHNCGACSTQCLPPAGGTVVGTASCVASKCEFSCPGSVPPADAGVGDAGDDGGGSDAGVPEAAAPEAGAPGDGGAPVIVKCDVDSGGTPGCFDLSVTSDHCGACTTQCPSGQVCSQSQCCPQGNLYCGSGCVDVTKDPNNCGACGATCPSPANCAAGKCTGYTVTTPTGGTFLDACAMTGKTTVLTNSGVWKTTALITLPITFTFYGTPVTQFWLQSQGAIGLGAPQAFPPPDGFPDCQSGGDPTTNYPAVVAFGDSSLQTGANGVCYATQGTSPNQQFVATWSQANEQFDQGSAMTFSVVLTQTTNTIDVMYQTAASADGGLDTYVSGANATVGMQAKVAGKLVTTPYSCAKAFIPSLPFAIRFTPVQ